MFCTNKTCNYQHATATKAAAPAPPRRPAASAAASTARVPCRFFPQCTNRACPFVHPPCRHGAQCRFKATTCAYAHPAPAAAAAAAPCRFGLACTRAGCPYAHGHVSTRAFAAPAAEEAVLPAAEDALAAEDAPAAEDAGEGAAAVAVDEEDDI
jgi:hypothetical protein